MTGIRPAVFPDDLDRVVSIFREYIASPSVNLDFQDYETEFAELPGNYAAPAGRLLLAWRDSDVVGCVALRPVDPDTCEMKRLYVRPTARGDRIGWHLVDSILTVAKAAGYRRICLDVLPEFDRALHLYESFGFRPAPAVAFNPVPGARFLGLDLSPVESS